MSSNNIKVFLTKIVFFFARVAIISRLKKSVKRLRKLHAWEWLGILNIKFCMFFFVERFCYNSVLDNRVKGFCQLNWRKINVLLLRWKVFFPVQIELAIFWPCNSTHCERPGIKIFVKPYCSLLKMLEFRVLFLMFSWIADDKTLYLCFCFW